MSLKVASSSVLVSLSDHDKAFSPNRLSPNAGPISRTQPRKKRTKVTLVNYSPNESAKRMALLGPGAAAFRFDEIQILSDQAHALSRFSQTAKIRSHRSLTVV